MQCIAKRRDGSRCKTPAVRGATVCRMHGGAVAAVKLRGQQRVLEAKARGELEKHGIVPITDPLTELSRLAGEVVALKDLLAERVQDLREAGAIEVLAYERALDRAGKLLGDMARLSIDERLVRISEAQAALLIAAVMGTLREDLGLSDEQVYRARTGVARRLRATQPVTQASG